MLAALKKQNLANKFQAIKGQYDLIDPKVHMCVCVCEKN